MEMDIYIEETDGNLKNFNDLTPDEKKNIIIEMIKAG